MCGCGKKTNEVTFPVYNEVLSSPVESEAKQNDFFAKDICVADATNYGVDQTDSWVAQGAGVFNVTKNEVMYNHNIHARLYPASTTKILTAYIICSNSNLDDITTVSDYAVKQAPDSSIAYLKAQDRITVRDLLYGLMLNSGNDAAIALAEYYSGSVEAFADVMNKEAEKLGATNSHFINPNGLPDDNHYTTVYDMYLIFSKALQNEEFKTIISTKSYEAKYYNRNGEQVTMNYNNTNRYLKGTVKTPEGFQIIGGKTGTTYEAGYCLVLYSQNPEGDDIISIVFKADCVYNLYYYMNQILIGFAS